MIPGKADGRLGCLVQAIGVRDSPIAASLLRSCQSWQPKPRSTREALVSLVCGHGDLGERPCPRWLGVEERVILRQPTGPLVPGRHPRMSDELINEEGFQYASVRRRALSGSGLRNERRAVSTMPDRQCIDSTPLLYHENLDSIAAVLE